MTTVTPENTDLASARLQHVYRLLARLSNIVSAVCL